MMFVVLLRFCALFLFFLLLFVCIPDVVVLIKFDTKQFDVDGDSDLSQSSKGRNSISSISSLEIDISESDELAPIPEVDDVMEKSGHSSEIFAIPNAKQCNSIIR